MNETIVKKQRKVPSHSTDSIRKRKYTRKKKCDAESNYNPLYPDSNPDNLTYYQLYKNMNSWRDEVSQAFIDKLCVDLIAWSCQDTSLRLNAFLNKLGICSEYFYRWMEKFPELRRTHEIVIGNIATRRDEGALNRIYDGQQVRYSQHMYDAVAAAGLAYLSKIKNDATTQTQEDLSNMVLNLIESKWNYGTYCRTQTKNAEISTATVPNGVDTPDRTEELQESLGDIPQEIW